MAVSQFAQSIMTIIVKSSLPRALSISKKLINSGKKIFFKNSSTWHMNRKKFTCGG